MTGKKTIDARGLFCPGPVQVLKGVVKQLPPGTTLELIADDPLSKEQVANWCKETENRLKLVEEKDGDIVFTIELIT